MPVSGTIVFAMSVVEAVPPSRRYTWPDAWTVRTRIAMLNSVRYAGFGLSFGWLSVDWLHPLARPTIIVACGPRRISDAMSTTYDTDMFEPLAIGKCTLKADVSDDSSTKNSRGRTGVMVARGTSTPNVTAPTIMTPMMYQRARGGSSRSK